MGDTLKCGLRVERNGPVAHLTIDRESHRNALTLDLADAIASTMGDLEKDGGVRVAVIAGAGHRAFSAGFDISAIDGAGQVGDDGLYDNDRRLAQAFRAIEDAAFPVVARIRGHCVGGGLELAMACDLRVAAEDARFRMPPAHLGWVYAHEGLQRFTSAIGVARTRHLFLTGEPLAAERAERWGLIHDVMPNETISERVETLCHAIATAAPISLEGLKQSLTALARADESEVAWQRHLELRGRALASADLQEGRMAFLERRRPRFQGC